MAKRAPAPSNHHIEGLILSLRGQRVILDFGLAPLYCVEVRTLNQAVRRNIDRFPADFMFRLTAEELESLRSQSVMLKNCPFFLRFQFETSYFPHYALISCNMDWIIFLSSKT